MLLLELLGRRWALRVLWELRDNQLTFRELQDACGKISPTVLNERLRELREGKLVDLDDERGYGLSAHGKDLVEKFLPIVRWADHWARS
jgi:DNA-binding HxlR family transcriptional regulator